MAAAGSLRCGLVARQSVHVDGGNRQQPAAGLHEQVTHHSAGKDRRYKPRIPRANTCAPKPYRQAT
jgi:hypothetical protein